MPSDDSNGVSIDFYDKRRKNDALKLTVDPLMRLRSRDFPAGTVKPLMLIVAHLTAVATSLSDEIVPVQRVASVAAFETPKSAAR